MMIRTQISLEEEEYILAKKEAKKLGLSLAGFLRKSLQMILPFRKDKPWMQFVGFIESGDKHSSQSIDEIVYGKKVQIKQFPRLRGYML